MATKHRIIHGDCLKKLPKFDDNSIDALCTDPPAGINFMNKEWDKNRGGRECWVMWLQEIMEQCYRVLKPGSHGFVWAIPRTSHWTATALEDAGFEIRDIVTHLFGSGFPKNLNISRVIDKAAGKDHLRKRTYKKHTGGNGGVISNKNCLEGFRAPWRDDPEKCEASTWATAPHTEQAKKWDGWGTALKPASEHWILIRKPCSEKTVAKNVLKWGVGGINIDACRVGSEGFGAGGGSKVGSGKGVAENASGIKTNAKVMPAHPQGRFPANLILDDVAGEMLDEQSGDCLTGGPKKQSTKPGSFGGGGGDTQNVHTGTKGGASRFFYCAKPSKRERNAGLNFNSEIVDDGRKKKIDNPFLRGKTERINTHPTVKSIQLMRYLCRLITPPKGIILDPFMGSGTTGCAAVKEGFSFIGIELDKKDCQISRSRIQYASQHRSD